MRDEVENLSFFHSEDNVEKVWRDLRELLTELTKKFVPLTNLDPECRNNLLFTNTTRQAIREKKKYWKNWKNRTTANYDNYKEKEMLLRQLHEMIKRQRK